MSLRLDPPLVPDPDRARGQLRTELLHPEYYDKSVVQRLLDWLGRVIQGRVDGASGTPPLTWLAITLIVVALVSAVAVLLSRARRTARAKVDTTAALTGDGVTAAELRARAERAVADGRYGDAVVDGFRALAVRQVEAGRVDDVPGATAHEVARSLAGSFPRDAAAVAHAASLFDAVLYGDREAGRDQALELLELDQVLGAVRR